MDTHDARHIVISRKRRRTRTDESLDEEMEPKAGRKQARTRSMQHPTLLQYLVVTQAVQSLKSRRPTMPQGLETATLKSEPQQPTKEILREDGGCGAVPAQGPEILSAIPIIPNASFTPLLSSNTTSPTISHEPPLQQEVYAYLESTDTDRRFVSPPTTASSNHHPPGSLYILAHLAVPQVPLFVQSSPAPSPLDCYSSSPMIEVSETHSKSEHPKPTCPHTRPSVHLAFLSCKPNMDSSPIVVPQILHIPLCPQSPR